MWWLSVVQQLLLGGVVQTLFWETWRTTASQQVKSLNWDSELKERECVLSSYPRGRPQFRNAYWKCELILHCLSPPETCRNIILPVPVISNLFTPAMTTTPGTHSISMRWPRGPWELMLTSPRLKRGIMIVGCPLPRIQWPAGQTIIPVSQLLKGLMSGRTILEAGVLPSFDSENI